MSQTQCDQDKGCPNLVDILGYNRAACPLTGAFSNYLLFHTMPTMIGLNHPAFQIDTESPKLRTWLRAYFTVLFVAFAPIANKVCAKRAQLKFHRNQTIRVRYLTGWLSVWQTLEYWYRLRGLPGGWFGLLMILVAALTILSDLAVSGLVRTVTVPSRCSFISGVVLPPVPVPWRVVPSNQQRAYRFAFEAQSISLRNGGYGGIYRKVNGEPNFRADKLDVVGSWNCEDMAKTQDFDPDTSIQAITTRLRASGVLYNKSLSCSTLHADKSRSDWLILSASVPDGVEKPWDVQVAMDMNAQGPHKPINMKSISCKMNAPAVEWILARINSYQTLEKWCLGFTESLENRTTAEALLSQTLNSMIMVGWDAVVSVSEVPANVQDSTASTQGCLAPRASVPWPVSTLFLVDTAFFVCMALYWLWLLLLARKKGLSNRHSWEVGASPPCDLLQWIRHSSTRHGSFDKTTPISPQHRAEELRNQTWPFQFRGPGYESGGLGKSEQY